MTVTVTVNPDLEPAVIIKEKKKDTEINKNENEEKEKEKKELTTKDKIDIILRNHPKTAVHMIDRMFALSCLDFDKYVYEFLLLYK
jgi:phosphatidate phosphatase PAH1